MAVKNISATIDRNLFKKLEVISKETDRNRSWLISKALENYLEELEDAHLAKERFTEKRLSSSQMKKKLGL